MSKQLLRISIKDDVYYIQLLKQCHVEEPIIHIITIFMPLEEGIRIESNSKSSPVIIYLNTTLFCVSSSDRCEAELTPCV